MSGAFISFTMYASIHMETGLVLVSKNISSGTYCIVEDRLVTWLILICCPSFRFGVGFNFLSNFEDTNEMLDSELIIIVAVGPSVELSLTVALEGCAPRKVVPGSLPIKALSWITSELKALTSVVLDISIPSPVAACGMRGSATLAEHWPSWFPATRTPWGCFHSLLVSQHTSQHPESWRISHSFRWKKGLFRLIKP